MNKERDRLNGPNGEDLEIMHIPGDDIDSFTEDNIPGGEAFGIGNSTTKN